MTANCRLFQEKYEPPRKWFTVQHGTRDGVREGSETGLPDAI
jgi:hypothetical protein